MLPQGVNGVAAEDAAPTEGMAKATISYKTVAQVADLVQYSPATVNGWIRRFRLGPAHGVHFMGKSYRIDWEVFEREFVQKRPRRKED